MTRAGEKLYHPDAVGTLPPPRPPSRAWRIARAMLVVWATWGIINLGQR